MKKLFCIIVITLFLTGCELGEDYTELDDIHTALNEIVLTDTNGDPVPNVSGIYSVTLNLDLPVSGNYDVIFSWESNNTAIVSNTGVVDRQVTDVPVDLTVTGTKGRYGQKRRFLLVVKAL
jgi:hypothetical protein